jgi:TnpA family transposase
MEHYILSEQDLALIRQRRGANNRIGMAVQLAFLRFPGRALQPDETPPDELLSFLAAQLKADGMVWAQYAERS